MERSETIVVVDDDREVRTLIELALAKAGRSVVGFGDGQEALDFLAAADLVDLVVSDVAMEGFDGHRLLRHLRANERTAATSVIFVTASDNATDRIGGIAERAVEYLRKPFDIADLRARADAAIRRSGTAAPARDAGTGLFARAHFDELLAGALGGAADGAPPLALMLGSLDDADPEVLRRVAQIISLHLRATDCAARTGETSFATLHPGCDAAGATAIAERILAAVSADPHCAGATLRLGVAVAAAPRDAAADALFAAADEALRDRTGRGARIALRTV